MATGYPSSLRRFPLLPVLGLIGFVLATSSAAAGPIVFFPTVDGSVRDQSVVIDGSIVQALHVPSMEDRGIIEFNLGGLAGPIDSATLSLPVYVANGPFPFQVGVFAFSGDGLLSARDFDAGTLAVSFAYSGARNVTLDVTNALNALLLAGTRYAGFNFRFTNPSSIPLNGPFVAFRSLEFGPSSKLVAVSPTPEPATLLLLAAGAAPLLWSRRRRTDQTD